MKDIYEVRRENLRRIVDDQFKADRTKLAELLGFSQASLLSRYMSEKPGTSKNIGPGLARKIEAKLKLPKGWMDTPAISGTVEQARGSYDLVNDAEVAAAADKFRALPGAFREYIVLKMDELQKYGDALRPFVLKNLKAPTRDGYGDWEKDLEADMARLKLQDANNAAKDHLQTQKPKIEGTQPMVFHYDEKTDMARKRKTRHKASK